MRQAAFVLALSVLLLAPGGRVYAQGVYMVTEVFPPLQVYDNGVPDGFAVEMVTRAAKLAGLSHTISVLPWSKAFQIARTGSNVCIFSMLRTAEREKMFKWASTLAAIRVKLYRHKVRRDIEVKNLDDAKRYRVVVARDDATHAFLLSKGFVEGVNLVVVDDTIKALRLMAASEAVDLMLMDSVTMPFRASEAGLSPSRVEPILDVPGMDADLWVAFSLDTPDDVLQRFSRAMDALKADGSFEQARIKWNLDR